MYIYKNEHNHQQADDWLWDTIPNSFIVGCLIQKAEVQFGKLPDHLLLAELEALDEGVLAELDLQILHLGGGLELLHRSDPYLRD